MSKFLHYESCKSLHFFVATIQSVASSYVDGNVMTDSDDEGIIINLILPKDPCKGQS